MRKRKEKAKTGLGSSGPAFAGLRLGKPSPSRARRKEKAPVKASEFIAGPLLDIYATVCGRKIVRLNAKNGRRKGVCLDEAAKPRVRIGFRPYQLPVFKDRSSGILILHWSRQIGKSFTLAAWAVDRLLTRPGRLVTVLSNSRENGAEFVAKCAEVCRLNGTDYTSVDKSRGVRFQNMRMEVRIRAEGKTGRIKVLAANPRTARGFSGDLILDEFGFHEDSAAIWEAAEPILASNPDFLCRMASTGNGRHNLFYRMTAGAGDNFKWEVRNSECGVRNEDGSEELKTDVSSYGEGEETQAEDGGLKMEDGGAAEGDEVSFGKARPHPNPLPQEREKRRPVVDNAGTVGSSTLGKLEGEGLKTDVSSYGEGEETQAEDGGLKVEDGGAAEGDEVSFGKARPHPNPLPQEREGIRPSREHLGDAESSALGRSDGEELKTHVFSYAEEKHRTSKAEHRTSNGEECKGVLTGSGISRSGAGYAVSRITRTQAWRTGVQIYDANTRAAVSPDEARAQALDKRAYDQNYECVFADENATLLSHELINAAEREDAGVICEQDWGSEAGPRSEVQSPKSDGSPNRSRMREALQGLREAVGPLYVGFDVARKGDLSVITVMEDLNGMKMVRAILRMRDLRLPEQQQRLGEICRLPKFRRAAIDMTGLGLGLFEYAQEEFGASRIHGINFATSVPATRAVRIEGRKREMVRVTEAMAMELLQVYEDRRIQHPADNRLRDDLRKPEKVTTPGGRVSIAATRDEAGHADHFWSFALALEAASHGGTGKVAIQVIPRPRRYML